MDKVDGLLLSVGMSVGSEIYSIKQLQPERIAFLCTSGSRPKIDEIVQETGLKPSQYDVRQVEDDPTKLNDFVAKAHEAYVWLREQIGDQGRIAINPTAGRKWMSAGITLFAGRTEAVLLYVDADFKEGKPVPGTERLVQLGSADDSLGMIACDAAVELFNRSDFEGAAGAFAQIAPSHSAPHRLYRSLVGVSSSLSDWDRFDHYDNDRPATKLQDAAAEIKLVAQEVRNQSLAQWCDEMTTLSAQIRRVSQDEKPSLCAVADLLQNARRKLKAGRYDDAGARAYRALEAIGEWLLSLRNLKPSAIDWSKIPQDAANNFQTLSKSSKSSMPSKLGLSDAFCLSKALGMPEAQSFFDGNRFLFDDYLQIRNLSILAHGWTPAKKDKVERFVASIEQRLRTLDASLPDFRVPNLPKLWT